MKTKRVLVTGGAGRLFGEPRHKAGEPRHKSINKALVTGGAGFVASFIVDKLVEEGFSVAVIDNLSTGRKENLNPKAKFYLADIQDQNIEDIFAKEKPDIVFHYAAKISIRDSVLHPLEDAAINVLGSINLLENCKKAGVENFIFASSSAVYGRADVFPTPEAFAQNPESPYGAAKIGVEKYLHYYHKSCQLNYVVLRYANIYGPRQDSEGEAGVVAIFSGNFVRGKGSVIFGKGNQTRDFFFVKDAADAAIAALGIVMAEQSAVFNVGTGVETDVNTLYKLLADNFSSKKKPAYAKPREGDQERSCLECLKIKKSLGFAPRYSLKEGLEETANWFKKAKK